jgi:hypothetical protein
MQLLAQCKKKSQSIDTLTQITHSLLRRPTHPRSDLSDLSPTTPHLLAQCKLTTIELDYSLRRGIDNNKPMF